MPKLILVKHSLPQILPEQPAREWRLSEKGRKRCAALAEALAVYAPQIVVTSVEAKAQETGAIVAQKLNIPCTSAPGLHEHERPFIDDPTLFEARVRQFFAQPDKLVFGTESANAAYERFAQAVNQVEAQHADKTLAIVAHGTVITTFVAHHNAVDAFAFWQKLDLPSFVVLDDFKLPDYML